MVVGFELSSFQVLNFDIHIVGRISQESTSFSNILPFQAMIQRMNSNCLNKFISSKKPNIVIIHRMIFAKTIRITDCGIYSVPQNER